MEILQYTLRKLIAGIPLILGVTLISFLLIVYFGPDKTYELLGKNPTAEEIAEVRAQLFRSRWQFPGSCWATCSALCLRYLPRIIEAPG